MPPSQEGVVVRHATREDVPTILQLIQELADYEKESSAVEATHESLLATLAFAPSPESSTSPPNTNNTLNTNTDTNTKTTPSTGDPISPTRPARALLLFTPTGHPAGLALYFYNYSTWRSKPGIYLEDLFVRETERGRGYGQRLLGELAKEVVQMGGGRLEWAVLKWNTPSIEFYERIGARVMGEWQTMRVDGAGLAELAGRAG